ncbi:response regulator transcription factor [Rudaeicoccus suwonensis]|uniref:LuxR family two component transcriptional regulator n=1 Tax=Rudaeicoccus suwonensis TaxID=657409 RepID=A0A561E7D3_9MICO|nr:response regulator transcription factor [Rudaeicoccus suwonensis]TWE11526.1 LuxR family two component transcriptional regulator [Rudaeicoccus suwonensis]
MSDVTVQDQQAQPMRPTRVLLVDDDPLVCAGIEMMLSAATDIQVAGVVHDGDEAVTAAQRHFPDVVLLDVRMQRMDGITATAALRSLPNPPRVIVLTTWDADDVVMRAIDAGAAGFLLKTAAPRELMDAVRNVGAGDGALSPQSVRAVFEHLNSRNGGDWQAARVAAEQLTIRELEVVRAVVEGLSNAEIGRRLYVGEATVKTHLASAQQKLGATNRVSVAVAAVRAGIA